VLNDTLDYFEELMDTEIRKKLSEVKILATLSIHQNIVKYFNSWTGVEEITRETTSDTQSAIIYEQRLLLYIQMEYCECSFRDWMETLGRLSCAQSLAYLFK